MSGSDAQTMVTSAEKTPGGWVLNGAKNWITNGPHADCILVFAVTDRSGPKVKHTAFLVRARHAGLHAERRATTSSASTPRTRAPSSSRTARCPTANVVGNVGRGLQGRDGDARRRAHRHRVPGASASRARRFETSVAYAKERKSFGVPIAQHQAIQFMLADMATEIDAARLLTWRAATMKDAKASATRPRAPMAKLYASEMATRVAHKAIQIHGGYGYSTEFPVERHYRDARITEIYEGTSEIQRIVIAASLLERVTMRR